MKYRGQKIDLEVFKELYRDPRVWFSLVRVTSEDLDQEVDKLGGSYKVECSTIPDENPIFVNLSQSSGLESIVRKGQVWLALFDRGSLNQGFLVQRLPDLDFPIHPKARAGHTVLKAEKDRQIFVSNDLSQTEIKENAVLGQSLFSYLKDLTAQVSSLASDIESLKNTFNGHGHAVATSPPLTQSSVSTVSEKTAVDRLNTDEELNKLLSDLLFIQSRQS